MSAPVAAKRTAPKKERRKSNRNVAYARYPVLIYTEQMHAAGEDPVVALLTDIGKDGLGLISDRHIKASSKVYITLQPGRSTERQLLALAVWSNPLPSAHRVIKPSDEFWRVGLRYSPDADQEQKDFILALLKSLQS